MPLSLVTSNGVDGYRAFIFNTSKHKETPLTNHMGLRTVVTYSPSEAGRSLQNDRATRIPGASGSSAKVATFKRRSPALPAVRAPASSCCCSRALRNAEPWMACAMGSMMIAVGVELTCYYYSFLFGVTLPLQQAEGGRGHLAGRDRPHRLHRLGADEVPARARGRWPNLRISQWLDEQYMWMSVATLVGSSGSCTASAISRPRRSASRTRAPSSARGAQEPRRPPATRKPGAGRRSTHRRGGNGAAERAASTALWPRKRGSGFHRAPSFVTEKVRGESLVSGGRASCRTSACPWLCRLAFALGGRLLLGGGLLPCLRLARFGGRLAGRLWRCGAVWPSRDAAAFFRFWPPTARLARATSPSRSTK